MMRPPHCACESETTHSKASDQTAIHAMRSAALKLRSIRRARSLTSLDTSQVATWRDERGTKAGRCSFRVKVEAFYGFNKATLGMLRGNLSGRKVVVKECCRLVHCEGSLGHSARGRFQFRSLKLIFTNQTWFSFENHCHA